MSNHNAERHALNQVLAKLLTRGWRASSWHDGEERNRFPDDCSVDHVVEEAASVETCHLYFRKGEGKGTLLLVWGNSPIELIADVGGTEEFESDFDNAFTEVWPHYPDDHTDMRYCCPKCGSIHLSLNILTAARLIQQDGLFQTQEEGDHHWDDTHTMWCRDCDYHDAAASFLKE